MTEFDVHIATQGSGTDAMKRTLKARGYTDDALTEHYVDWIKNEGVVGASCPIIDLHMTRKDFTSYGAFAQEYADLHPLLVMAAEQDGLVGYVHGEVTLPWDRVRVVPTGPYIATPLPFARFDSRLDKGNKRWDLHMRVRTADVPAELAERLSFAESGMCCLQRVREGEEVSVYTIQGVNNVREGRTLLARLGNWATESNLPVAIKMEVTSFMDRFGDPEIVPPTICDVAYI